MVKPGSVAIDIGANCGDTTVPIAYTLQGMVLAFEVHSHLVLADNLAHTPLISYATLRTLLSLLLCNLTYTPLIRSRVNSSYLYDLV
jgi:hypothetical protein